MSRYIDADELKNLRDKYIRGEAQFDDEYDLIDKCPTIYAVPVVYGHWETNSDRPDSLICSVCKCGFDMWKHDPHNYCPNCGSKMDGEAENASKEM